MKQLILLLTPLLLFAQSYLISTIPLPKTYVQNLEPYDCDEACMQTLLEHGRVFSFLAAAQQKLEDPQLNETRLIYVALFNLGSKRPDGQLRIAMMLPYNVIGRYAFSTSNAVFSYMLTKNRAFEIKNFVLEDESEEEIRRVLGEIERAQYYYVIAPLTKQGAAFVAREDPELNIYFPTINKNDMNTTSPFLYFGGIDYKEQTRRLLNKATSPLVIMYDKSPLGNKLLDEAKTTYLDENITLQPSSREERYRDFNLTYSEEDEPTEKRVLSYAISKQTSNLEPQLKENRRIQFGSFLLNTPLIKSGMVVSQLTLYDVNTTNILSTQINYDPLILSMTQARDRENMLIANSISSNNNVMVETNALLSNDIVYDWINYATMIGTDYFYHLITDEEREYQLSLDKNQIVYPIILVKPSASRFVTVEEDIPLQEDLLPEDEFPDFEPLED
jgi:hypothetical protein